MNPRFTPNRYSVQTDLGIDFSIYPATPISRMIAVVIDFCIISTLVSFLQSVFFFFSLLSADLFQASLIIAYFSLSLFYPVLCEWRYNGQTIGKKIMKIRVIDDMGGVLEWNQILFRNFLRVIDSLPLLYCIGGIVSYIHPKGKRLGDIAANTVVVRIPSIPSYDSIPDVQSKYNSFNALPHLEAKLRQRTSPQLRDIAMQALQRKKQFDNATRQEIFDKLMQQFVSLCPLPPEITQHLSSEQYVRNCLQSIYRKQK